MSGFAEISDQLVAAGLERCSNAFRQAQRQFLLSCQLGNGAFGSPAGDPDLYYTEFALRALALLDAPPQPLKRAAEWLSQIPAPADEIAAFGYLNARRILAAAGIAQLPPLRELLPLNERSLYRLFLGLLCRELAGMQPPASVVEAVLRFRREDGAFAESFDHPIGQTNATAAGLSILLQAGCLDEPCIPGAAQYLLARQCADGGFAAHAALRCGDLLSTFTATLTLGAMGKADPEWMDLAGVARFVRQCARIPGGFAAEPSAAFAPDAEYTYYGLALTGLLRNALA